MPQAADHSFLAPPAVNIIRKRRIERFDEWLARQPHRTKIVLRGNHDPFSVQFPISGANFFSKGRGQHFIFNVFIFMIIIFTCNGARLQMKVISFKAMRDVQKREMLFFGHYLKIKQ